MARSRVPRWFCVVGVAWGSWSLLPGCAAAPPRSAEIPVWELAFSEPIEPRFVGRARVRQDRPLPEHLVQPLCDELTLVTITSPADWTDVRRRLRLDDAGANLDFSQGMVVGIQANVGECADGTWPIRLESVRVRAGQGWLKARFEGGLYYPLLTAGYLELAYVPELRSVRKVEVGPGPRTFIIRSREPLH